MKRHSEKYRLGILAEMNITPLLDLAFVLLIIFVITSPFLAESVALEVSTGPDAAQTDDPSEVITVTIDSTLALFLDGEPVAASNLESALSEWRLASSANGNSGVVIEAHRDLPVHDLLDVMEQIKSSGITQVGVVAQTENVSGVASNL